MAGFLGLAEGLLCFSVVTGPLGPDLFRKVLKFEGFLGFLLLFLVFFVEFEEFFLKIREIIVLIL